MAGENDGAQFDLEGILNTLKSLPPLPQFPAAAPQTQQQHHFQPQPQQQPQQTYDHLQLQSSAPFNSSSHPYPTNTNVAASYSQNASLDPRLQGRAVHPQHRHVPPQTQRTPTSKIDVSRSSTITEWKYGLRFVSKIAAQNPAFGPAVQKLIKDQERNIRDWDNGRNRLIEEQTAKRENEQTQRAAISFLANAPLLRTPEREQEELSAFYHKVYRACKQMTDAQSAELSRLGVPFFGVRPDLVVPDEDSVETDILASDGASDKITQTQLVSLQRKMLNHLVEMYDE